jgi:hypothetical protein
LKQSSISPIKYKREQSYKSISIKTRNFDGKEEFSTQGRSNQSFCITPGCYNDANHNLILTNIEIGQLGYACRACLTSFDSYSDVGIELDILPDSNSLYDRLKSIINGYPSFYCLGNLCFSHPVQNFSKLFTGWGTVV